jgi:hypothetical protein
VLRRDGDGVGESGKAEPVGPAQAVSRQFEREKFGELVQSFEGRVTHGAETEPRPGEERAFTRISV